MNWLKEVFWSDELSVLDNLAMWAVGIVLFIGFYALLFLAMLMGEVQ